MIHPFFTRKNLERLEQLSGPAEMDTATLNTKLAAQGKALTPVQLKRVQEATAIAAYRAQKAVPVVRTLLTDDAAQFEGVTSEHALCWIHDGRLYKKLTPFVPLFQGELDAFLTPYWAFYRELRAYRETPAPGEAVRLAAEFDRLFKTKSVWDELTDRIDKTRWKKHELLQVLAHPELPLHNNESELGARQRVRKRDVSFGPRTAEGANAWDTFQSLAATCKKLGVSFIDYIQDRIIGGGNVPPLAALITQRAGVLKLGHSWEPPAPA